jgi:hypothetical protein
MHHIKQIRKGKVIGFSQVMKQLNRKQVPLCKPHHDLFLFYLFFKEKGQLDNIKISDLYFLDEFLA